MIHLGICYGHNATVAVVKDGQLVFCQSEERLNRIKNSTGFPTQTMQYIYKTVCRPEDVASATLFERSIYGYLHLKARGFEPYQYGDYLAPSESGGGLRAALRKTRLGWALSRKRIERKERNQTLQREARAYFASQLRIDEGRLFSVDHHLSHAYSALPNIRGWSKALVFTLDGQGDWISATVNVLDGSELTTVDRTDHYNSLGYFYSAVTALMGMKPGEHEFKVMGLAPYAKREHYGPLVERLTTLLDIDDEGRWVSRVSPAQLIGTLEKVFRYQRFDNTAGAIQELTERLILRWVRFWIEKTGIRNVAVAGGVFMNVKACQQLAGLSEVERIFVVPSAADESTAIGCAVWGAEQTEPGKQVRPIGHLYLGMEYSDAEALETIRQFGAQDRYVIREPANVNEEVGRLLAGNEIVARCSGRMEFGARALGNRSILANPSRFENLEIINAAIKSRDFWMPFTPSVLASDMDRYIVGAERIFAPYMCITFDTTEAARADLKAAIHPRDRTVRPQCVLPDWNPDYHEVISTFKRFTGIGAVLNTSFNLHGEPNVCSPADAIRTVDQSGLRFLALGRYVLEKKDRQSSQ